MDSLKKGSGKINIPIAIRFSAIEDSIEDVSSITQNTQNDETSTQMPKGSIATPMTSGESAGNTNSENWRKEFLQGSFFNRKRSGSNEDISSTTSQTPPTGNEPLSSSLGTWKMFKGKVSQAIVDIKSSKSSTISDGESDLDDDRSENSDDSDTNDKQQQRKITGTDALYSRLSSAKKRLSKCKINKNPENVSKDSFDRENSPLRSSFLFKKKPRAVTTTTTTMTTTTTTATAAVSPTPTSVDSSALKLDKNDLKNSTATGIRRRKFSEKATLKHSEIEIESGIEITEEMSLHSNVGRNNLSPSSQLDDTTINSNIQDIMDNDDATPQRSKIFRIIGIAFHLLLTLLRSLRFTCISIFLMNGFKWSEFIQGFICSSCISLDIYYFIKQRYGIYHLKNKTYGVENKINKKVAAQSESMGKKIKNGTNEQSNEQALSYTGWINEIKTYDPNDFHYSMTRTVYVKLDGSKLRLSSYSRRSGSAERVSKRALWSESVHLWHSTEHDDDDEVPKKKISLTNHRYYDLLGCRVEMLPLGIARKRHFSRKYPIRLTIRDKQPNRNSPVRENEGEMNWFDFEEIKEVSAIFLERERQYEIKKDDLKTTKPDISTEPPTQLILFARCDREKEDWYRRFNAASQGMATIRSGSLNPSNIESDLDCGQFSDMVMINADDVRSTTIANNRSYENLIKSERNRKLSKVLNSFSEGNLKDVSFEKRRNSVEEGYATLDETMNSLPNIGLLMTSCAARGPSEYVKFMSSYQCATSKSSSDDKDISAGSPNMPVNNNMASVLKTILNSRKTRRSPTQPDTDSSAVTTPTKSTNPIISSDAKMCQEPGGSDLIWLNVLMGRILYSCLNNKKFATILQEMLKKKLNAIKLPPFMENVSITNVNLGNSAPTFENIIPPVCDERGLWLEADISYEGLMNMTISTKLNLMRLKKVEQRETKRNKRTADGNDSDNNNADSDDNENADDDQSDDDDISDSNANSMKKLQTKASIYDSDAESSGASSTDSDSLSQSFVDIHHTPDPAGKTNSNTNSNANSATGNTPSGSSKKILRIVDRITASNLFQSATELSYVQKAMKNMSTNIRLCVELKGISGRIIFNVPPPPSDRLWLSFRHPPKLIMSATPAVGETTFDWDIITSTIESKLYEEVLKYLVYPNMVDVILPILGQSTYSDAATGAAE